MDTSISTFLKTKRKELKFSVKDIVKELSEREINVSEKTVYSWESGHRQPDADTFLVLCDIYNVENLNEEFPKNKKSPEPDAADSREIEEVYKLLKKTMSELHIDIGNLTERQKVVMELIADLISDNF